MELEGKVQRLCETGKLVTCFVKILLGFAMPVIRMWLGGLDLEAKLWNKLGHGRPCFDVEIDDMVVMMTSFAPNLQLGHV
ncbi:hypothetical protein PIB30_087637 [Stylosanthes scabra]|uniref:Uncharacterized protein n=1 Tax=Stylosanthes scabra TaxID=79078 RepID=A0ABU6SU30_9FABA|nr:hypothetical protein [Stylosanthes scabra]